MFFADLQRTAQVRTKLDHLFFCDRIFVEVIIQRRQKLHPDQQFPGFLAFFIEVDIF